MVNGEAEVLKIPREKKKNCSTEHKLLCGKKINTDDSTSCPHHAAGRVSAANIMKQEKNR
jgi:hypothetical protein